MPSTKEIKAVNNKQSPEYSRKIYPKNTVTDWQTNKTFTAKKDTKKVVIPSPHKKLERKQKIKPKIGQNKVYLV